MNVFLQLHLYMVPVVLIAGIATMACGITLSIQNRRMPGSEFAGSPALLRIFRRLLVGTALLGVIQAVFGGVLYVQGLRPADPLHYVYGLIVLAAVPVAYAYSDQKQVRRDIMIMTIAAVAIIGAAVRAFMTGM